MRVTQVLCVLAAAAGITALPVEGSASLVERQSPDAHHIDFINQLCDAYSIPRKQWSEQLAANAYHAVQTNQGRTQDHILTPPTQAQVLTPGRYTRGPSTGEYDPFQLAFYGWLCEVPEDSQLGGRCPEVQRLAGLTYNTRGHHDILVDPSYTQIGCAFFQNDQQQDPNSPWQGIWGCDLTR